MTTIEQAGAIILNAWNPGARVLLVTSRRDPAHWLFPKGHVEPGESLEEAALREAEEEAGIRGALVGAAGDRNFELGGRKYQVHYFVVTTADEGTPEHGREMAWLPYEEALERLSFEDTRDLLRRVWATIREGTC